ncbi:MAG: hypothetical protein Q4G58_11130, partial [bacterium]|nr:hypothetical protein [bacterium]
KPCQMKKPCYEEVMPTYREKRVYRRAMDNRRSYGYVMDDNDDNYADDMDARIAKYYGYCSDTRPVVEERYSRYYDYDNDGVYDAMYDEMYKGSPYAKRAPRRKRDYARDDYHEDMTDRMDDCGCDKAYGKADVYDVDYAEYCTGMYKGCFAKPMRKAYIRTWEEEND